MCCCALEMMPRWSREHWSPQTSSGFLICRRRSVEDLRSAKAQRERTQRQREIEAQRIEKAQRELARRQGEYDAAVQSHPASAAPPAVKTAPVASPGPTDRTADQRVLSTPPPSRQSVGI